MNNQPSLEELKRRFPIQDLWRKAGYPEPRKWSECSNPWREDKKRSFSVREDGMLYNDFSEGGGDNVRFWAVTRGITDGEAIKEFRQMAVGENYHFAPPAPRLAKPKPQEPKKVTFPKLTDISREQRKFFCERRNIDPSILKTVAHYDDCETENFTRIRYGKHRGLPSLFFIEKRGEIINTACRRLNGKPYETKNGNAKEVCLVGTIKNLPLGLNLLTTQPDLPVALVEGTPDFLSAWQYAVRTGDDLRNPILAVPLGMLGGSNQIHPEALKMLAGRTVRIFPHIDSRKQGQNAGEKWASQLFQHDCQVEGFDFSPYRQANGESVTDLNELLFMKPEEQPTPKEILPSLPYEI